VFSEPTRAWFDSTFEAPTPPQALGWPAIARGDHTLILAPTGTGKTLSAFMWALDRLAAEPLPEAESARTRVLYISPLRALAIDIEKNLRAPLRGITLAAQRLGSQVHTPTVGVRTGDTSTSERRRLVRRPPDILITTPESLFLMLTSKARETLVGVEVVIIDEIHAMAGTKRGAHLMMSIERLEELCEQRVQRVALSATQRPLDEISRFLGGSTVTDDGAVTARPVTVIDAGATKELRIEVVVPIDDMGALGEMVEPSIDAPATAAAERRSIWPSIHPRLLDLIHDNRSTLIFANSRRLSERLTAHLNELDLQRRDGSGGVGAVSPDTSVVSSVADGTEIVKAHHGSLSRERRLEIEDRLKRGELRGLVATSSLELGIDMGAVDLVVQVSSPGSVSSGMQRIGRAGHRVGEPSRGKIFPKHRADLLAAAVVVDRMKQGLIEETRYPREPLDVLAQQIVAMCAMDDWSVDDLAAVIRRCANFSGISDEVLGSVLDMLSGVYPSEEFAGLRPRIVWDRAAGVVRGRSGSQRLAVTNAGTIPDRGLFGVFLPDGTRVGELDEEMVYESRVGETFLLGASTWRIDEITFERVIVTPAPGQPGKMPFWHGDGPGRPLELGRAIGAFVREIREDPDAVTRLTGRHGLDDLAARNLLSYLDDQAESTGVVPDDRTIVVERFRDEIGDWRVCVLTPFGAQVNAPWGMALRARLGERWGTDVEMVWSDDGLVLRLPESVDDLLLDELMFDPDEVTDLIVSQLPDTSMFASRFRECSARALLLPRRRPGRRTPLWQQRQRSADLLSVASAHPSFPMLLEATRECVNDVFDVPALRELMSDLRSRRVRMVAVDTPKASPFAQSLLFSWIAVYMYEGDAPLAERRAAALTLDRELLRDLLGAEELRELLDPGVLGDLELELQRLVDGRRARDADEAHDLLRELGPLSADDLAARSVDGSDVTAWLRMLVEQRRAFPAFIGRRRVFVASDDASRVRDALGVSLPVGLPAVFTEPVDDPLGDLCLRYARTHGPFLAPELAPWLGADEVRVRSVLDRLRHEGRLVRGEFRPGGVEREFCHDDTLRRLRRRSLAVLRSEIEPVDPEAFGRFLPAWQGIGARHRGMDGTAEVISRLQGAPLPASVLESDVLPARMSDYRPSDLDALCTTGRVVWVGAAGIGANDGRIRLVFRDQVARLVPPVEALVEGAGHDAIRARLDARGASFWPDLVAAVQEAGLPYEQETVLAALWDLVWAGEVTNDSFAAVRARLHGNKSRRPLRRSSRRVAHLSDLGPPDAAGRWSLVSGLRTDEVSPTEAAHARARQLLDRYGVLTREAALGEGQVGGFAGVYPVLKMLEERGEVRRGYFVAGLGAAQFALAGAVDRLRSMRETPAGSEPLVLAATDPAQPYGAALGWPPSAGRPTRTAGAHVVLTAGVPVVVVERGGRSLITFAGAEKSDDWIEPVKDLVRSGRLRRLEIAKVDGVAVRETGWARLLEAAGFSSGYRGLSFRG